MLLGSVNQKERGIDALGWCKAIHKHSTVVRLWHWEFVELPSISCRLSQQRLNFRWYWFLRHKSSCRYICRLVACWEVCTLCSCPKEGIYVSNIELPRRNTSKKKHRFAQCYSYAPTFISKQTHRNQCIHLWVLSLEFVRQVVLELLLDRRPILEKSSVGCSAPPPILNCLAAKITALVVVGVVGLRDITYFSHEEISDETWDSPKLHSQHL